MPLRNERRARPRKATTEDIAKVALAQSGRAFTDVLAEPGADGDVLTADSAEEAGMKWATPAAPPTQVWELIGVTEVTTGVAQVEQTFTADAYSQILVVFSDLSATSTSGTLTLAASVRHSGGAIATATSSANIFNSSATAVTSGRAVFDLGRGATTKRSNATMEVFHAVSATVERVVGSGVNATSPDRVRLAFSAGNIDGNSTAYVYVYGLKIA